MNRRDKVLKLIVEHFIKTAQPVGSKTLIEEYGLDCSSATIRAEMNALEVDGLLEKTHTSSGRVPSSKGYRFDIENLRERSVDEEFKYQVQTILDQKVVAGLGIIYADEALFDSKIHPKRMTGTLSDQEIENLLESAKKVMTASIESGGSTMQTYVKADGTKGDYLRLFAQIFRHEGEPCVRCGTEVQKIRVAGRGTHICPNCQKETQ